MAPNQRQRQLVLSKKELRKINRRRFSKYAKLYCYQFFCYILFFLIFFSIYIPLTIL